MNFLFSNYTKGQSFSEIVKLAKEKGYTEPDPRDDLSGMDVARKILILSREMGLPLEPEHIEVKGLVPENCVHLKTVEEFFVEFAKSDSDFEKLIDTADKQKKKLRYMASVENGKAKVALVSVDDQHPFYSLKGSDNIVSFTTRRYYDNPLIVRGPGAGAEVTAAGVFADIIRIVNYLIVG
jgi:aspartokinase/homoserine dehydrogenase 1